MTKYYCPDHPNTQLLGRKIQNSDEVKKNSSPEIMVCPIDGKHHLKGNVIEIVDPDDFDTD